MPEAPWIRSALDSVGHPAAVAGRDIWLWERSNGTITRLEGRRPGRALTGWLTASGITDLPAPGRTASCSAGLLLPTGPGVWLLLDDAPSLTEKAFDLTLDVTGAWTGIAIGGSHASDLMAKGCAIDLHPREFPAGACAAVGFAGMRTIIWRSGEGFELLVGRSYALSLWEWLVDAAAEYAASSDPPQEREQKK